MNQAAPPASAISRQSTDLDAFGRIYRECYGLVRSVVARLGVPPAAVDDAVQDVFVVVHRRRSEFDPTRAIEPWLVGIARRVAFRYRRTHSRGERKLAALSLVVEPDGHERLWMRVEAERFLARFLDGLGEDRRAVFLLAELHGLTGPEIADRLQLPVDTVYTRLRAGRQQLERALLAAAAEERPPEQSSVQRAWLLLLPRLADPPAAPQAGWLAAGFLRAKTAVAALIQAKTVTGALIVTAAALPVVAPLTAGPDVRTIPAPSAPVAAVPGPAADLPPRPALTTAGPTTAPSFSGGALAPSSPAPARSVPPITLPQPPRASRFEALLHGEEADPSDGLGAAEMARAVEALAAGDPNTALVELDRHAQLFPRSPLEQARVLMRIRVLCQLGRADEARRVATRMPSRERLRVRAQLDATCVRDGDDEKIPAAHQNLEQAEKQGR